MASGAMEAFAAATNKAQPQSQEELESVLNELPRRELVALSKTHGVQATLKRESLVAKLLRVLPAQLWPTEVAEKDVEETEIKGSEAVTTNTTEEAVEAKEETTVTSGEATETTSTTTIESAATTAVTAKTAVEKKKAPGAAAKATAKAMAAAVVGKKTVATTTKRGGGALSPGKLKRATPVKASAGVTPKKNMDKIHAKQSAKQMTLQEHEQAKKMRAALLLSGSKSKFSVVKKTRSKTKEIADANGDNEVAKTLSFGAAKTPVKKTSARPSAEVSATKIKPTYKPHAGPLPAFTGDSLFSPKKVEPRPAPMAVAVMKAARTAAPKKVKVTKPTAVSKATPTKKSPVKKSPATKAPGKKSPSKKASLDEKENVVADNMAANTTTLNSTSSNTATKTTATRTTATKTTATKATVTKPRASVKSTATSTISHEAKKETRRATFAQNAKAKSTASRQQTRTATSSRISKTKQQ